MLNLYYEEERMKAKKRSGTRTDLSPKMEGGFGEVAQILAKKAGIGKSNMYYLMEVKRKRLDLYEKVFNGEYTIGRAHAEMKRDEQPKEGI